MRTALPPFLVLVWLALAAGCSKPTAPQNGPRPVVVALAPVVYSTDAVPVRVAGVISRGAEADLSFKIAGIIEEIRVRAGDRVKGGEVLARLRQDEIEAQVVQARSALDKLTRDLERVEKLRAGNVATKENAQDAATAVEVAAAGLRVAEFNRQHAVISAPGDGRVLRRSAEPNELVAPGRPILTFGSDTEGWLVRAGLSERDLARVQVGDSALVIDEEVGSRPVAGKVRHISEATDPATRTTEIEIKLDEAVPGTRSGYVVAVQLQPQPVPERPVVPPAALVEGAERKAFLFLLEPGRDTVRRLAVDITAVEGDRVFLSTMLPRDARIVTAGAEYLRDGATVEEAKGGS